MRIILTLFCVCLLIKTIAAQDLDSDTAAIDELNPSAVKSSRELVLQASSRPEAKLGFTQRFEFPFLQGSGPLTENNNIKLALTAEVSPISLNGIAEAILTPVAFLEFLAGARIGTGWNIELFGNKIHGIGIHRPVDSGDPNSEGEYDGSAFDGLTWQLKAGGAFQFDLAALLPGDWNHIVFRTYHEINFGGYSRAKTDDAWIFENKDQYSNGFIYYSNYLVGYQMPIILSMVALLAEAELYLYDHLPNRGSWGDERVKWVFGAILNFAVLEQLDIALITQIRTVRNYHDDNEDLYYRNRAINTSNPHGLEFYRVAAVVTYRF
jgi:hypothetical protein